MADPDNLSEIDEENKAKKRKSQKDYFAFTSTLAWDDLQQQGSMLKSFEKILFDKYVEEKQKTASVSTPIIFDASAISDLFKEVVEGL